MTPSEFQSQQTMVLRRQSEQQAASHQEIQNAKACLERWGYEVHTHENGHLIVRDPVHGIAQGGRLELRGFKDFAVRSYDDARKFVNARS